MCSRCHPPPGQRRDPWRRILNQWGSFTDKTGLALRVMGGHNAQLPLLVMVSGAPGSGKTTLAKLLAKELDVPWLNRDTFSRGIRRTEGAMPASSRSWSVWYGTLASLLSQSVSLVMDQTMYRGIAEPDIETRLLSLCRTKLIHCHAPDALERFKAREKTQHGELSTEYQRVLSLALEAQNLTIEPPNLAVDLLRVDTSESYRPALEDILGFILSD